MLTIYVREGTTSVITFQLLSDKAPINLTGVNKVELVLVPQNGTGTAVDYDTTTNPTVLAITAATLGKVTYTPQAADLSFANSPYKCFFWVFTTSTVKYSVPAKEEFIVEVSNDFVA